MVVTNDNVDMVDWNTVVQRDIESVRFNKSNTNFLLKFNTNIPYWYVNSPIYSKQQVISLLSSGDW